MKVGILSDIHGNSDALTRVLEDASDKAVEKFLVLGDIVGYYYHPEEVIKLLSKLPHEIIRGNHEVILQDIQEKKIDKKIIMNKYGSGHEVALQNLSKNTLNWLYSLPLQKSLEVDGVHFQMNHGSPWNYDEYIYPDADTKVLDKCDSEKHDFVLIGHSHYAFSYKCEYSILINSGSVGQSRRKGGVAEWALVDTETMEHQLMETPYDVSKLLKEVLKNDPNVTYNLKILTR